MGGNILEDDDIFGLQDCSGLGVHDARLNLPDAASILDQGSAEQNGEIHARRDETLNGNLDFGISKEDYSSLVEWPSSASPLMRLALGSPTANVNLAGDLLKRLPCDDTVPNRDALCISAAQLLPDISLSMGNNASLQSLQSQCESHLPFSGIALETDATELYLNTDFQQAQPLRDSTLRAVSPDGLDVALGTFGDCALDASTHISDNGSAWPGGITLEGIVNGAGSSSSCGVGGAANVVHPIRQAECDASKSSASAGSGESSQRSRRRKRRACSANGNIDDVAGNGKDEASSARPNGANMVRSGGGIVCNGLNGCPRNEEEMRKIRRVKNRASVEKCRMKQRQRMEALESELKWLRQENLVMQEVTKRVQNTFDTIRAEVVAITGQDVVMPL